jgi:hypothetical protein
MFKYLPMLLLALAWPAMADEPSPPSTSVEDNIRAMDKNHDGMVAADEVRAFIEARLGKDYEQQLLDDYELMAGAKSCASPFSRSTF